MKRSPTSIARRGASVCVALLLLSCGRAGPAPPETRRDDTVESMHGVSLPDPYRWLEDGDSAETLAWIEGQRMYTQAVFATAPPDTELRERLNELVRVDETFAPAARGGRYFFARRPADRDHPILYVRRGPAGADEVLVDPHDVASGASASVGYADISPDGSLVAYAVRRDGEDEIEVRFIDVESGEHLADTLARGRYDNISIDADRRGVFYDRRTPEGPRVLHRVFGTEHDADRLVFGRGFGPETIITSGLSSSGRYLLISVHHGTAAVRTELYFRDTWTGTQVHTIVNDIEARFEGHIAGDTLFVLTDWEAPNRRVFAANLRRPTADSWTEIIREEDTTIEGLYAVGGRLLVRRLDDVRPRLAVYEPDGFPVREVTFSEISALDGAGGGTWESDEVFFAVGSVAHPPTIFRYRVSDGDRQVWAENQAPIESTDFETEQVRYASADGTSIPMFVSYRRGLQRDGTAKALLSGSGGFGVNALPRFNRMAVAWMEHGGVWATAGLRGGGEFGASWHRAGMLELKENALDDFVAAAEWLIRNEYTTAGRLAIRGEFDGGLLVGAALTRRPDLFAAAVGRHAVLDMLRYHRFLEGPHWVPEYGSADDPAQFEYLSAYSPYHRVDPGTRYPSVMLVAGSSDTRVAPLHARKMTALLQASSVSANPVLLLYDDGGGSSGARSVDDRVAELTAELRFMLWQTTR